MHADRTQQQACRAGARGRLAAVLVPVLLLAATPALRAENDARDINAVFQAAAQNARTPAHFAEAMASVSEVATNAKVGARFRQRAFELLMDIYARHSNRVKAIESAEAMRLAFPNDAAIDREAVFAQADLYAQLPAAATNAEPAVAALQAYVKRRNGDNESCAQACLRMARFQLRADQYDAAQDAARTALARDPANADLGIEALWLLQDTAQRAGHPDERLRALEQVFEPKYRDALTEDGLFLRRTTYADTLRQLKRYDALRRFLGELERTDTSPVRRQQWCLAIANTICEQGQTNEAFAAFERVFTAHPEVSTSWFEAQSRVVDLLVAQKLTNDALRAAHILYDAARDAGAADRVIQRMAEILRQGNPREPRAEAIVAINRFGPAGPPTAKRATPTPHPQPVLPAIGYPDLAARHQAFDAAGPTLGDGVDASLQRAWCAIYAGDPRLAVTHFADALRRSSLSQFDTVAKVMLQNGFRPLQGHSAGLADIGQFIVYGPDGADGKPGTEDDPPDPFAALGVPAVSTHPGGLVPLAPDEIRDLQALIDQLRELIRRSETPARQIAAVGLYQRAIEALVVVDRRETLDWILATMQRETDDHLLGALARLGASVARSDQLHLAAARQFYADVVQQFEQAKRHVPGEVESAQRQFDATIHLFEKKQAKKH